MDCFDLANQVHHAGTHSRAGHTHLTLGEHKDVGIEHGCHYSKLLPKCLILYVESALERVNSFHGQQPILPGLVSHSTLYSESCNALRLTALAHSTSGGLSTKSCLESCQCPP